MELSLSAAARMTGKAKSTIHRAIKAGRLSAQHHDDGTYTIDPVELWRAFPQEVAEGVRPNTPPPQPQADATELAVLRTKVELLTELLEVERRASADLRRLLPSAIITPAPPPTAPQRRGLLALILGR